MEQPQPTLAEPKAEDQLKQQAQQMYRDFPGLTCEAIAKKLKLNPIEVYRCLGYAPTKRNGHPL